MPFKYIPSYVGERSERQPTQLTHNTETPKEKLPVLAMPPESRVSLGKRKIGEPRTYRQLSVRQTHWMTCSTLLEHPPRSSALPHGQIRVPLPLAVPYSLKPLPHPEHLCISVSPSLGAGDAPTSLRRWRRRGCSPGTRGARVDSVPPFLYAAPLPSTRRWVPCPLCPPIGGPRTAVFSVTGGPASTRQSQTQ